MWNLDIRQSFTRFRHLLRVALLVVLVAATGPACIATLLFTLNTPTAPAGFVRALAVGDVNGDGKRDIAVGAFTQGRVYVFSGADGSLLFTLDPPNPQAWGGFGDSVAMGDVDGDGRDDIAVGDTLEDVGTTGGGRTSSPVPAAPCCLPLTLPTRRGTPVSSAAPWQ